MQGILAELQGDSPREEGLCGRALELSLHRRRAMLVEKALPLWGHQGQRPGEG